MSRDVLLIKEGVETAMIKDLFESRDDFRCQMLKECSVDLMICARPNVAPAIPFIIMTARHEYEDIEKRICAAAAIFPFVYGIELFPRTMNRDLQRKIQRLQILPQVQGKLTIFPASSIDFAYRAILNFRENHRYENERRAKEFYQKLRDERFSRAHAIQVLWSNFRFISPSECEMLLDIFGSIGNIITASVEALLDRTPLDKEHCIRIATFFNQNQV
ncbi:hypothetical protein THRCLA_03817 [Thraustotheca clavata]|uniref:Uncharacterized protein n=1 Tax=Thraustotheca clavata TaxID=74557 RepID=A0A1W0A0V8_9STRA|nr:hypothetical protein THRCLA_03817 [Thraustotheca clavata]